MYAGLDASGTPDLQGTERRHNPYVVAVAAITDMEAFEMRMANLRTNQGMAIREEFHAHQMIEERQIAVIQVASISGLRIGALIIDKPQTREFRGEVDLPSPSDLEVTARLALLETFFANYPLKLLQSDEDIKGDLRQNQFKTEVKRLHRTNWPEAKFKIQYRKSSGSDLVQLADVLAYGLAHLARGAVRLEELRIILERLSSDTKNIIMGPMAWDR